MAAWWLWFTGLGYFAAMEIAKERVNARWPGDLGEQLRTDRQMIGLAGHRGADGAQAQLRNASGRRDPLQCRSAGRARFAGGLEEFLLAVRGSPDPMGWSLAKLPNLINTRSRMPYPLNQTLPVSLYQRIGCHRRAGSKQQASPEITVAATHRAAHSGPFHFHAANPNSHQRAPARQQSALPIDKPSQRATPVVWVRAVVGLQPGGRPLSCALA